MKHFFAQDKIVVGLVAGLGSELLFCLLLALGLTIAGEPIAAHIRWFAGMFVPVILLLHHYSKRKTQLNVVRTLIVVFFITFLAFMIYTLRTGIITIQ